MPFLHQPCANSFPEVTITGVGRLDNKEHTVVISGIQRDSLVMLVYAVCLLQQALHLFKHGPNTELPRLLPEELFEVCFSWLLTVVTGVCMY